jgi:hypothetical protein
MEDVEIETMHRLTAHARSSNIALGLPLARLF